MNSKKQEAKIFVSMLDELSEKFSQKINRIWLFFEPKLKNATLQLNATLFPT